MRLRSKQALAGLVQPSLLAAFLAVAAGCGQAPLSEPATAVLGDPALALTAGAPQGEPQAPMVRAGHSLRPWEECIDDAHDTLLGSGFTLEKFVERWGQFDATGRHRPDLEPYGEALGRPVTEAERLALEERFDQHEPTIREAARPAYDTLRVALDAVWQSGQVIREPFDDQQGLGRKAYDEAAELGGYTYYDSFTTGGWVVSAIVPSPEHPEFHFAFKELKRALAAREADAKQLLGLR